MSGCWPSLAQPVRQLADRGGLAGAVDADDEHDVRRRGGTTVGGRSARANTARSSVGDAGAEADAAAGSVAHRVENAGRGRDADVGAEQQFLQRLGRLDVDALRRPAGGIGAADDRVEPLAEPLGRARQPLRELLEQTHRAI